MKRWSTASWIFLAVGYAAAKEPATLSEVIGTADGINKAIPTQSEMQRSLAFLRNANLIIKIGKRWQLTQDGKQLLARAHERSDGRLFAAWDYLTEKLPAAPPVSSAAYPSLDELNVAESSYRKWFWRTYKNLPDID